MATGTLSGKSDLKARATLALDAVNDALRAINDEIDTQGWVPDCAILALLNAQGELERASRWLNVMGRGKAA